MNASSAEVSPPPLRREVSGAIERGSLIEVIGWFLDHDPRVNAVRHKEVEELFQRKQQAATETAAYTFNSAEDRLAIGIFQALATHTSEAELHEWILQLLNALDESTKINEAIIETYNLDVTHGSSAVERAAALPTAVEQEAYLTACWLEALCTAEARVLGWIYQSLYDRPFHPNNF